MYQKVYDVTTTIERVYTLLYIEMTVVETEININNVLQNSQ